MNQKEMVVQYMKDFGSITPWEAFTDLGCTKLSTRVSELIHEDGMAINKETIFYKNRYGKTSHYTKYTLGE